MLSEFVGSVFREFRWGKPITSYRKVQILVGQFKRGQKKQVSRAESLDREYLNVGCGPNARNEFINLDYHWRPSVDVCWDITKGLPIKSGSLKGIYTEHCHEHITLSQHQEVLNEYYRCLKPGGTVRIVVPDAEIYIDLYQRWKNGEKVDFPYVEQEDKEKGFTPIMSVNRVFREHGHLYCYDSAQLTMMLEKAGFKDIKKEKFRSGRDKVLLVDTAERELESLYIEASK